MKTFRFLLLFFIFYLFIFRVNSCYAIDFDDLMLDKKKLVGQTVEVKGYCFNNFDDNYLLNKSGSVDEIAQSLTLNVDDLSRAERKWLMQNCKREIKNEKYGTAITLKGIVEEKYGYFLLKVIEVKEAISDNSNKTETLNHQNIQGIIDFDDLMLDKKKLIGQTVEVKGYCFNNFDDNYLLNKSGSVDEIAQSLTLNVDDLSRAERKWLMQNCKREIKNGKYGTAVTLKGIVEEKYGYFLLKVIEVKEAISDNSNKTEVLNHQNIQGIIDFDDLMLDKKKLIGQTVEVKGYCFNNFDDNYLLNKSGSVDEIAQSLTLNVDDLSRAERKWLMQNCKREIKNGKYGTAVTLKGIVEEKYGYISLKVIEIKAN